MQNKVKLPPFHAIWDTGTLHCRTEVKCWEDMPMKVCFQIIDLKNVNIPVLGDPCYSEKKFWILD